MASIAKWRGLLVFSVVGFLIYSAGAAQAADMCTGPGQILVPSGNGGAACLAGYDGSKVDNCNAIPNPITVITAQGGSCVTGPSCPAGYVKGLPPQIGSNALTSIDTRVCQAVCSPLFTGHGWPCSCPCGQHLDVASGYCKATCGPSATWQHTPGLVWTEQMSTSYDKGTELHVDPGVCTCPAGNEFVAAQSACMVPCPAGDIRDGSGACTTPYGGGKTKTYCENGQAVGACVCPPSGVDKGGKCFLCSVQSPAGACQSSGQPPSDGDYNQPTGLPVSHSCAAGLHWNGVACIANKPSTPSCGTGTHLNGNVCVPNVALPGLCPAGTHWDGAKCVATIIAPLHVCRSGQHWDSRTCVADGCSSREHWDGQRCVGN